MQGYSEHQDEDERADEAACHGHVLRRRQLLTIDLHHSKHQDGQRAGHEAGHNTGRSWKIK